MYLIIINELSGNSKGKRIWRKVEAYLKQSNISYTSVQLHFPQAMEKLEHLLKNAPQTFKAAAIIGGDGTIHSLLPLFITSAVPLSIIPAGSGNDTARALGIPGEPIAALKRMLAGRQSHVDLIESYEQNALNEPQYTITAIATGFDGAIADAVNRSTYKRWCNRFRIGSFAYVIGIFQTLVKFRPIPITITVDGNAYVYEQGWLIAIANAPCYGGGLYICPDADIASGTLQVCIVHSCKPLQLLRLLPTLFNGSHIKLPYVTLLHGSTIEIEQAHAIALQAFGDGEPLHSPPLRARVAASALTVIT